MSQQTDDKPCPKASMDCCLGRIEESNDALRAVVVIDRERCALAAEASERRWADGTPLSSIDGLPVLVKANFAVAGLPWTAGIKAYRDRIASDDAPSVARLRAAGVVILGLTNMDEAALGATGTNHWLGRIGNPRDATMSAGGSSGGSAAAVAAGYCAAALGSDTIGSIAIPSAYCGVVGHRASRHLLPVDGVVPLSDTFDHVGWHAHTVADAIAIGRVLGLTIPETSRVRIAAPDLDALSLPLAVVAAMADGIERARRSGCTVDRVNLPVVLRDIARPMFEVAEAEAAIAHRQMLSERPADFSPTLRRMLDWGAGIGAQRHAGNIAKLRQVAAAVCDALSDYDSLLIPAVPHAGFATGTLPPGDQALFAALPACLGWPATTVPTGSDGLALLVTSSSDSLCLSVANRIASRSA